MKLMEVLGETCVSQPHFPLLLMYSVTLNTAYV